MQVVAREGESFENLLKRFKNGVVRSGVLKDSKRKRHFISKSAERRDKIRAAQRRQRRRVARALARQRHHR